MKQMFIFTLFIRRVIWFDAPLMNLDMQMGKIRVGCCQDESRLYLTHAVQKIFLNLSNGKKVKVDG